jgi:hypothetical protein
MAMLITKLRLLLCALYLLCGGTVLYPRQVNVIGYDRAGDISRPITMISMTGLIVWALVERRASRNHSRSDADPGDGTSAAPTTPH